MRAAAQLRRPITGVHRDAVTAAQRLLVRFQSRCQLHHKRESQRDVSDCRTLRSWAS